MPNDPENAASEPANFSSAAGAELLPGTIINDTYKVVSLIGRGGMGAVYRVHQEMLGKDFAIKVLDLQQTTDVAVRRFQQEARTASQLQHPNLVEVHDFGMFGDDQPFLVMDLVEGVSLSEVLKKKGSLPFEFVVGMCIQLCFGLMYAHEKGVVHRDIKPGNIMLLHPDEQSREGTVKIVDFGIAKLVQSESGEIQTLTKTGEIFGSPLYMSPEQCKGDPVDKRSDIYSLGCVIFECLTGSPPFFGDTAMSTMMKRLSEPPVTLKEGSLGRDFPQGLENAVRKMLAIEPNDRYQDLGAVVKDLMAIQRSDSGATAVETVAEADKRDRRGEFVVMLVVSALLSVVGTFAVDAYVIFPEMVKEEIAQQKLAEDRAKYGKKISAEEANAKQAAERKALIDNSEKAKLSLRKVLNQQDAQYPYLITEKTPKGAKQFIVFPFDIGVISINFEYPGRRAFQKIELPPNSSIVLRLNKEPSTDPSLLKNLTHQHFASIEYGSTAGVNSKTIEILEFIPYLTALKLEGSEVDSLEPIYKNTVLNGLEVMNTLVPVSELLRLQRLKHLQYLTFGPTENTTALLKELARHNTIGRLHFKPSAAKKNAKGQDLKQFDVAILAKLTNLQGLGIESALTFTDEDLEQLTPLKNLRAIVLRNTGVTPKSINTFKKFPHLELVRVSRDNWPDADLAKLRKVVKKLEVSGSRQDMRDVLNRDFPDLGRQLQTDPRF